MEREILIYINWLRFLYYHMFLTVSVFFKKYKIIIYN